MSLFVRQLVREATLHERILSSQLEGLTQEQTLLQPPQGGNCANWVIGHLIQNREMLLRAAGLPIPWDVAAYERYRRDSDPIVDAGSALEIDTLLHDFAAAQRVLLEWLNGADEEQLKQTPEGEQRSLGDRVAFHLWHETYHLGQLEQLRALAGRTEKVI